MEHPIKIPYLGKSGCRWLRMVAHYQLQIKMQFDTIFGVGAPHSNILPLEMGVLGRLLSRGGEPSASQLESEARAAEARASSAEAKARRTREQAIKLAERADAAERDAVTLREAASKKRELAASGGTRMPSPRSKSPPSIPPMSSTPDTGCYLTLGSEGGAGFLLHWSEQPIESALAYFRPSKPVPHFKFTQNAGRSELLRESGGVR